METLVSAVKNGALSIAKFCTLHLMYFVLEYFQLDHFGLTMDESPPSSLMY